MGVIRQVASLLLLAVGVCAVEDDRWSKPATAERRQGDWVPLTCVNCRPMSLVDQGAQGSNSLPSVLTPPPRVEEARLLPPPPPPPDGLFQTAATGFLQQYTQQQPPPPRKPLQFLQETSSSINRPQAQFLKSNIPLNQKPTQGFFQEPSSDFQPPQQPQIGLQQSNRQAQLINQFNQQIIPEQPYLNQPLFLGPQFAAAPFFPQTSIPPQNIQQINPVQVQQQSPISPNVLPSINQNFQVPADRPVFLQQITATTPDTSGNTQQAVSQTSVPQVEYSVNGTNNQKDEEREEVQLLYVPVETLNQRARNIGKQKSLSSNQGIAAQTVGTESNTFTSPGQNFAFSTRKPHFENQNNFNTQIHTSKHQHIKQQFQQQHPPTDQEKYNSQIHSVREQFSVNQDDKFLKQPLLKTQESVRVEDQNTKQYTVKQSTLPQSQFQQDQSFNLQFISQQQNPQFQQALSEGLQNFHAQQVQQSQQRQNNQPINFNRNNQQELLNNNQQFVAQQFVNSNNNNNFQQQTLQQESINNFGLTRQQQIDNQNQQFLQQQLQINHQPSIPVKEQPYINQPIKLNPDQSLPQVSTHQSEHQHHFNVPELQTVAPVTKTRQPITHSPDQVTQERQNNAYVSQQIKSQRFRNPQIETSKNPQQTQNQQFHRLPEDYQEQREHGSTFPQASNIGTPIQNEEVAQKQQHIWKNSNIQNQKFEQNPSNLRSGHHHSVSSVPPPVTASPQPQTTLAPNQPPLSVYMETTEDTKVNDVLRLLKNAKSIQVLDTIGPDSPQVFVGPSNLNPPSGYIKFELPYLNSLDSNRVERKVDKLPFFVAPLNFNPPPGYSKIPFPAPHIGSVVVSNDTVLRTALHDKPFFRDSTPPSSSEKYLDQYTLPAQISPISPQLPSLINSLQDEIFSESSTPTYSSTEAATTTETYTTPLYRTRGTSRGSQRGSSGYTTSSSPSRRPQSRTRRPYDGRPYSRRQPTTTPTTTLEPSTEAPAHQYTPQQQQNFNSDVYSVQNTPPPFQTQILNNPSTLQPDITANYYDERFVANGLHENQYSAHQPTEQSRGIENIQQVSPINNIPQGQQYQQQSDYSGQVTVETTAIPTVATPEIQREDQTFKEQRPTGSRREPLRQHQRFRGRQRLTTTTTENYEEPVDSIKNHFNQQTNSGIAYQNVPNRQELRNHDQSRLVENTHFHANVPQHNVQTERADVELQTTEKVFQIQNEQQFIQQPVDNAHLKSQLNNQFQASPITQAQDSNINQANLQHQFQQPQFSQQNFNSQQIHQKTNQLHGFDQIQTAQQNSQYTNGDFQNGRFAQQPQNYREQKPHKHQENSDQVQHEKLSVSPLGQNYYDQLEAQPVNQEHHQSRFNNEQSIPSQFQDQNTGKTIQPEHVTPVNQFQHQVTELNPASPQEIPTQTQPIETTIPHIDDSEVNQHNQQRLVKYNRPHSRPSHVVDSTFTDEPTSSVRGHVHFQSNENNEPSTSEPATTKASLVRVRGRVRGRQRASTRVTTTETPNYPSSYLNRQRNNAEKEENQQYVNKKRVNFNNRQSISSVRHNSNKGEDNEQSFTEPNYASTDRQSIADRFSDYSEVTTTTTTEASTNKPSRRYQHILNRNKIRRVRPTNTPSTSGSTGTTKFLLPTTSPPITRLPLSRGRIRKPISVKTTTTTEYPQVNSNWNERDSFAPSAGSNEILEPLYQTKDKQQNFGFQRTPVAPIIPQKATPKPQVHVPQDNDDDDYWNQAVTIQQSTSFDFKPETSPVTPPSFQDNRAQGTFAPIWNGQIELQDGNYYDIFSQQQIAKNAQDQTPFSSDQQKVVYTDVKSRIPIGKENQYSEKTDVQQDTGVEAGNDHDEKVYPVYREVISPSETLQEETSQVVADLYEGDKRGLVHEKDSVNSDVLDNTEDRSVSYEETESFKPENEAKEGPLKRKIISSQPGKKGGRRRGSWVRVRVRKPQDVFETAESQNLASLSENAIPAVTKTVGDKGVWTPESEPITEAPQTTVSPEVTEEPVGTINFEDALKDMLKEFITNPEEEQKEEETAGSVNATNENVTSTETVEPIQSEENSQLNNKNIDEIRDGTEVEHVDEDKSDSKDENDQTRDKEEVKTALLEGTTETFTQEPITMFQTVENAETTIEPEKITTPSESTHKTRVLGTSTTTEISLETEICYRGRCVKTKKGENDSDLLTME